MGGVEVGIGVNGSRGEIAGKVLASARGVNLPGRERRLMERSGFARRNGMRGIWIAFGIGAAAGAAVALLYAPQSGSATRKQLRKGAKQAGDRIEDAGEYLRDQAERLTDEAQAFVKKTRSQMNDIMDATGDLVDGAMKTAKSVRALM